MSEIKLLSCPFCGGEAKICDEDFLKGRFVYCTECGIQTQLYVTGNTIEKAVSDWNTRKPMERIVERLEEKIVKPSYDCVYGYSMDNVRNAIYQKAIDIVRAGGKE